VEPRKNLATALDAWNLLAPSLRRDLELLVAGPLGWNSGHLAARMAQPGTGIRYLGYLPEEDLPAVMAGASVFLYPSYYEGFGFPVLEAMAAGAPVVTSNVSALPEIAGSAALLIDPHSAGEIAGAVRRILLSSTLAERMRACGMKRAAQFPWSACARRSIDFFQRVSHAGFTRAWG
jgi:alpha-1,3-rhamnosyl/mannosyltransferase